ncbi:unnamed protein product [Aphanomyces euteiches]|nr:hypothetical protein Ae201684P_004542 [Aphanomyces euteiches]KAH9152020.1 hypothetical protein AeRB84_005496 [Aphanomyces euteiches]
MRIDEVNNSKKRKQAREKTRKDLLEPTGERLCQEAETRVAKRARITPENANDANSESAINDLLELEKKRHEDEHEYRMERLKLDKEEQQLRRSQAAQMESIVNLLAQIVSRQQNNNSAQ